MVMNNTCVTFGNFEFVHAGHRKVAETVAAAAKERGLTSVAVIWEKEGKTYTTEEEQEYLLKSLGMEMVVSFDEISVEQLFSVLLAKAAVVGENCDKLQEVKEAAKKCGVELITVPVVEKEGQIVTSELVKEAFEESDFETVENLCGHPYIMIGEVVHGKALGRTKNMPTANLEVSRDKIKPKEAVYAARIRRSDEVLNTVTNIGTRPTVDDDASVTIEALILDFAEEIYGEKLVLEVKKYIRDVKKFRDLGEVKKQIDQDIEVAKRCLEDVKI